MEGVFGIKPYGESAKLAIEKPMEGIQGFLVATCLPALQENGQ